jgi:hypothetical protein
MALGTLAGIRLDIEDLRKRHANSILNTATGRALGAALDEIERLRKQRPETTAEVIARVGMTQPVTEHDPLEGLI